MSPASLSTGWHSLPTEMKSAIVDVLDVHDVRKFARVDRQTYNICVQSNFKTVKISSYEALRSFLDVVPRAYYQYIHHLEICTKASLDVPTGGVHPRTDALASLLSACPRLEDLSLRLAGSLANSVTTCFPHLRYLRRLSVSNWGSEEDMPISERLVVSIAASVPGLEELTLNCITRSAMHSPELVGVHPYIPLVSGDENIEDHPLLGSELSLPSLLSIPSLRKLAIRDTHLGDPRWATTPVSCRLEILDLGSCYHEDGGFNTACAERIMAAVGPTVDEFSLTTAVCDKVFTQPHVTPLQRLRKLHITPFFPVDSVVETMTTLAGSPIESLSLQCYEDDAVDVCSAVEEFLNRRVERGSDFYNSLTRIDVAITAVDTKTPLLGEDPERVQATKRLQEYCRDLRLSSEVTEVHDDSTPICEKGKYIPDTVECRKRVDMGAK